MRPFLNSFEFAVKGLKYLVLNERNFRVQFIIGILVLLLAFLLPLEGWEFFWILFSTFFVLSLEGLNTVVEALLDFMEERYHRRIEIIKDISAGTVLLGSMFSVIVATIIFGKALFGISRFYGFIIGIILDSILFGLGLFGGGKK
ncbi:MAG: diacylglycerol kinase family protein [Thermotogae bacterium]|uniref:Diacylglycerol kinase family protein n=1 Tax=Kosmotoga arenicorallina TaxID=688066 RepID=A0A7C5DX26_9BACT|nr:diacylglycerol kinase family protein [Kosmotoga sp.]MBO8166160.1 diacylglycerol kinase family protein [Kosmotoga sp.]MCD6159399.1 diacylglycerol kinase family protein [Kosmotoga sp.]RKX51008.1 MAG: diacylglycerol kinase family protein [Thermotogota bacterium]HHF08816.1 diacylglycerol kinase family protein [Kosmotoga arenicorallina]